MCVCCGSVASRVEGVRERRVEGVEGRRAALRAGDEAPDSRRRSLSPPTSHARPNESRAARAAASIVRGSANLPGCSGTA